MPSAPSTRFLATGADLRARLASVESRIAVDYAPAETVPHPHVQRLTTLTDRPGLGAAENGSENFRPAFVAVPRGAPLAPRRIDRNDGTVWWSMDQLINPGSVVVRLSGVSQAHRARIAGSVTTTHRDDAAAGLAKSFHLAARRMWAKGAGFWWGPEALGLARQGWRATQDVRSPSTFDLLPPPE